MRGFLLMLLILALPGAFGLLFVVKHDVRLLREREALLLRDRQRAIEDITVLRAEWNHLTRPERVEDLAARHLDVRPFAADSILTLEDFPVRTADAAPTRNPLQFKSSEPGVAHTVVEETR